MQIQKENKKTGAFLLFDAFVHNGVKYIFGYPGGAILPIYDELFFWEQSNLIEHILVRHEQGASHAADGYARATNKIGVCFATSGPGATNLVTGIATAQMDSIPLIVITGQVARSFIGTDAFQETDIFGITLPIVKHSYVINHASEIPQVINEAFYLAQNGRPGPVLIDIPKDVGLEESIEYKGNLKFSGQKKNNYCTDYYLTNKLIKSALALIKKSSQPLLYIGGGSLKASQNFQMVRAFIKDFQIPLTNTLMGKGIFDTTNNISLGMLGMHGTAYANFAVNECDLLIALGARFDDRVTGKLDEFAVTANIIHVDIDPAEIGKNRFPQLPLIGDVQKILHLIIKNNEKTIFSDAPKLIYWTKRIKRWKVIYPLSIPKSSQLTPQKVISLIGQAFPTSIFTTDVGQHQMWSAQFINLLPNKWISSSGLGTMGFGLPAAIGAALSNHFNHSSVICITGDSSFQMCLQELATVRQYNLPIKIFIINNKWQGMVRQWQQSFYDNRYSHSYMQENLPNFELLGKAYSISSYSIENEEELNNLLNDSKFLKYDHIALVDVKVVSEENCYPMVSPGKSNAQMIGIDVKKVEN